MFDHPTPAPAAAPLTAAAHIVYYDPTHAPTAAPDLTDFHTFKDFARDFERQKLGTVQSLRWLARFREKNGLLSSGAMVELKTPGSKRPRLLVNRPRFAQWLATQSTAVAA